MNLAQTLVLRDRSIKNSILTSFPEEQRPDIRAKIEAAFKEGSRVWEERHLPVAMGRRGAEKVKQTMNSDVGS